MKLDVHVKKYLEGELMNYPLKKKALSQARQEQYRQPSSATGYVDVTGKSVPVNSGVEKKVSCMLTDRKIMHLENDTKAVEDILSELPAEHNRLIELKYFKSCSNQFVADELNISLRTFYHWRDKVLGLFALRRQLI